jgi:membrane-associated phospholipid phosphatase
MTPQSLTIAERLRRPAPNAVPAILLALIMPAYHVIVAMNRGRIVHMPELALDRAITVAPIWMLAYGSIWIFAFLPVFVVRQPALMRRFMLATFTVIGLAYVGFLVYPTVLPRAETVGDSFFARSLEVVYSLDPPYNCFPSLHVAWAFVAALTSYRVHRGVGVVALVWATLIGVSTLYTKQHYAVDVIGGIAIAYAAYALFLRGYRRETIAATDRRLAPKRALRAVWLYGAIVAFLWTYRLAVNWITT